MSEQSKEKVSTSVTARADIWDIAQHAGVSIATVSRVLNGRPDVAEATRSRVLSSVQKLGYVSNRHARALASKKPGYIGFAVPQADFFTEIMVGANDALAERDANLVICTEKNDGHSSLIERFQRKGLDGMLLVLPAATHKELSQLRQQRYPFVVIEPRIQLSDDIPVIASTNISGARMATEHLIELGHQRIGVITGYPDWCASIDRLAGFHAVLISAGLYNQHHPDLVCASDFTTEGGYQAAKKLLQLADPPTAIFAFNDSMALGAMRAAQEAGKQVPKDLSVVGFNDAPIASLVAPALTTVRQLDYELGRMGVTVLFQILEGQQQEATRFELSNKLIIRASTARPRA